VNWLLDTNIVSEWTKPRPDEALVAWLAGVDEDRTFLSVITLAELRQGIEALAAGRRHRSLEGWFEGQLKPRFAGRVLPIDSRVAELWAAIRSRAQRIGVQLAVMDAFVAATAEAHRLTIVTKDTRDFRGTQVAVLDPSRSRRT
jgi:toxin FitB